MFNTVEKKLKIEPKKNNNEKDLPGKAQITLRKI